MQSIQREQKARSRSLLSTVKLGFVAVATLLGTGFGASACLDRPLCDKDCTPKTTNIFVETVTQKTVDKIDLLFMIDNSISMADKQVVLKDAVPDLVRRLVSPNCVNTEGGIGQTPADPAAPCPSGFDREFTPIKNIHIGVITSSLGGHGADSCSGTGTGPKAEQENDKGHLIATRPRFGAEIAKYPGAQAPDPNGFLDWNPTARGGNQDINAFNSSFQAMVTATSEFGCGYEAQLESIYRFLVDPKPYERIEVTNCSAQNTNPCAFQVGTDANVLNQRKEFLRPDSLVAIIMVTDENDCSIIEKQQGYYAARDPVELALPRATAACAANPNDVCCVSCISTPPPGCQPDPGCQAGGGATDPDNDAANLRCFNQKKRFGLDFLYPTSRYVNAFTRSQICTSRDDLAVDPNNPGACRDENQDGAPDVFPNPLFGDLKGTGALPRDATLIFFAGIIGVPYQDIQAANNPDGQPWPAGELHYQTASEIDWNLILGNPNPPNGAGPIAPRDTLMVESTSPRGGNDGQSRPLAGIDAPALANPVNSHEWGNTRRDDLMYACVFPLPAPRDCAQIATLPDPRPGCDCEDLPPGDNNPLCQNPRNNQYERNQHFAKAYPGLRELQVLKDFGKNSIVASICARNLTNRDSQDYGYRPAVDAIVDRLKEALTGRCLPRTLVPNADGSIPCSIIEVRPLGRGCDPNRKRTPADETVVRAAQDRLRQEGVCGGGGVQPECSQFDFCLLEEAGLQCHKTGEQPVPGWCYVDPAQNPDDDAALVEKCPVTERRIIRFVDPENRTPEPDAKVLIACFGSTGSSAPTMTPVGTGGMAP